MSDVGQLKKGFALFKNDIQIGKIYTFKWLAEYNAWKIEKIGYVDVEGDYYDPHWVWEIREVSYPKKVRYSLYQVANKYIEHLVDKHILEGLHALSKHKERDD